MTCAGLIPGPYDIRNYEYESYAIATNMCPEGPYRGVGMVTAVLAHERLMDLIAGRLALDPAEVRRVNFVTQAQMPYVAATGHPYESGGYGAALDAALAAFGYAGAREEQVRARAEGRRLGIGIGSYVEFTGAGSSTVAAWRISRAPTPRAFGSARTVACICRRRVRRSDRACIRLSRRSRQRAWEWSRKTSLSSRPTQVVSAPEPGRS